VSWGEVLLPEVLLPEVLLPEVLLPEVLLPEVLLFPSVSLGGEGERRCFLGCVSKNTFQSNRKTTIALEVGGAW